MKKDGLPKLCCSKLWSKMDYQRCFVQSYKARWVIKAVLFKAIKQSELPTLCYSKLLSKVDYQRCVVQSYKARCVTKAVLFKALKLGGIPKLCWSELNGTMFTELVLFWVRMIVKLKILFCLELDEKVPHQSCVVQSSKDSWVTKIVLFIGRTEDWFKSVLVRAQGLGELQNLCCSYLRLNKSVLFRCPKECEV